MGLFSFGKKENDSNFFSNNLNEINERLKLVRGCHGEGITQKDFCVKIALFQQALKELYSFKTFCESKKGGKEYFYSHFEHVYNGNTNEYFSKVEMYKEDLNHALYIWEVVVPLIIEKSKDTIMQKDLYGMINLTEKEIKDIISEMECEKLIRREKSGNSYVIKLG